MDSGDYTQASSLRVPEGYRAGRELDVRRRNNLAQKSIREKRKQKYDWLEREVERLSEALAHQERQKAELQAQIQDLQARQALQTPHNSKLLPQLPEAPQDFCPASSWANFDPEGEGAIILSQIFPTPRRLTREQAQQLSLKEVRSIQAEYLLRAGQLLAQDAGRGPEAPTSQAFKNLMAERRGLAGYISCWLPSFNFRLHDVLAPCLNPASTAPIDHKRVLRVMELSWQQKLALYRESQLYIKKTEAMFRERRDLMALLKEPPERALDQKALLRDLATFGSTVARLLSNSDQAHLNNCYFWGQVLYMPHGLTERQEAAALLECHPHYSPDICRLDEELKAQLEGAAEVCSALEPTAPAPVLEDEPYKDMLEKMVTEFARIDYRSITGAQMSKALQKRPPPKVQDSGDHSHSSPLVKSADPYRPERDLDVKKRNSLAQKGIREKRKQKFTWLEAEVARLSEALAQQERQKDELLAEIQDLQARQAVQKPHNSLLLPQLQEAPRDFYPATSWANWDPEGEGAIILSQIFPTPRRLTRELAQKLSLKEVRSIQAEYLLRAGQLLAQDAGRGPEAPTSQAFKDLMAEYRGLSSYTSCWLPSFNFRLHDVLAPCLDPASTPPIDHKRVLRVMGLSWQQKLALYNECQVYIKKMEAMFQERRGLLALLKEPPERALDQKALLRDLASFGSTVARLLSNCDQAHLNNCYFWGQVLFMPHGLTERQEAVAMLECHPHYSPDICRLAEELESELQGAAEACCVPEPTGPAPVLEDEPYKEMVEKLVTEFARIDYRSITGAQMSRALQKRPPPKVQFGS